MRLININTKKLEYFVGKNIPPYVCLSHRWSADELSFETYDDRKRRKSVGRRKIEDFCKFVRELKQRANAGDELVSIDTQDEDRLDDAGSDSNSQATWWDEMWREELQQVNHVWCDTVCIDKRSSAELSEAINSMGNIYKDCQLCVAYLVDVTGTGKERSQAFKRSQWFTRCWTLQELIFPWEVIFCDSCWCAFGAKRDAEFAKLVVDASGVPQICLQDRSLLPIYCVAQKMSWASRRSATRVEDEAYSLLGLFDINMPLLYGEGSKAFQRLQMEIIGKSDDESVYVWAGEKFSYGRLLAMSAREFRNCASVRRTSTIKRSPYTITNMGLEIESQPIDISGPHHGNWALLIELNCARPMTEDLGSNLEEVPGGMKCTLRSCFINVEVNPGKDNSYHRVNYSTWQQEKDEEEAMYRKLIHGDRSNVRRGAERVFHITLGLDAFEFRYRYTKFVESWKVLGLEKAYQIGALKRKEGKEEEE